MRCFGYNRRPLLGLNTRTGVSSDLSVLRNTLPKMRQMAKMMAAAKVIALNGLILGIIKVPSFFARRMGGRARPGTRPGSTGLADAAECSGLRNLCASPQSQMGNGFCRGASIPAGAGEDGTSDVPPEDQ